MLSNEELIRYKRQIKINKIKIEGQEKLKNSKVLVVGAGGLASPALYYLASAGIGTLGIIDFDSVSLSNLNRQILYSTDNIGALKVDSASEKLLQLNPHLNIIKYKKKLTQNNTNIVKDYDIVVDCVDNLDTRQLVNEVCQKNKIPLVEAGVENFSGFIMTVIPGHGACYRCLFPVKDMKSTHQPGVLGSVPGVAGSLQALEAVKVLLNIGKPLVSRFLVFDLYSMAFDIIHINRNPHCPVCGNNGNP
jgi:molybdopterin/thiamine biosynthesis adenylyltransferase